MKNNKTIYKFLIVAVIISLFASCKQDVIFYDISQEVEYETPIVEGNIFSMVPCKGILFVQNNMIYQKGWLEEKSEEQKWEKIESPVADKAVTRLASDENYLYALVKESTSYIGDVYVTQVTSSGIGSWSKVASNVRELYDNRIFDKNNGTTVGRHAYFTDSINLVSRLDGTQGPERVFVVDLFPPESLIPCIRAAGSDGTYDYFSSNSEFAVANVSGETYFYSSSDKTILVKSFTVLNTYSWDSITGALSKFVHSTLNHLKFSFFSPMYTSLTTSSTKRGFSYACSVTYFSSRRLSTE